MTAARRGLFLLSLGLLLPRLFGGDSPATVDTSEAPPAVSGAAATISSGENGRAKSSSKVRQAIVGSFSYNPSAREKAPEQSSPVLVSAQPVAVDPDVVVMAKLEVTSRAYERGLPSAIANWRDPSPQNNSRFGTGLHQKDFGKVRASMVTILYVPILVGISW
ncbi:MAG TPA: hypothetical protein VHO24_01185 [Opitutaceae bacterium]|nr:hypothetical protein [Opitutaceae bacterium]